MHSGMTDPDGAGVTLRDGRQVFVRPIHAGDGAALTAAFERLSERSKQLRFGTAPHTLGTAALRHLIDSVDGVDHVAYAAFDDGARLVGVGRILRYPNDPETLDVGMVVADDFQGAGLGHVLGYLLAAHRPRPAKRILTHLAADSAPVTRLLRAFGADPKWTDEGTVIELPD